MSLNIMEAFEAKPQPIDYVLPNLAIGTIGAIVSPGGVGKSMLALQLAVQITCGVDLLNFGEYPTGLVAYLPVEDSETIVHHRLYALGKYLTARQQQIVADKLLVEPLVGKCPNIFSPGWSNLINEISKSRRLIILDTLRRFHQEDENNSGAMSKVLLLILGVRLYFYTIQTKALPRWELVIYSRQAGVVASWLIIYGGNLIWRA